VHQKSPPPNCLNQQQTLKFDVLQNSITYQKLILKSHTLIFSLSAKICTKSIWFWSSPHHYQQSMCPSILWKSKLREKLTSYDKENRGETRKTYYFWKTGLTIALSLNPVTSSHKKISGSQGLPLSQSCSIVIVMRKCQEFWCLWKGKWCLLLYLRVLWFTAVGAEILKGKEVIFEDVWKIFLWRLSEDICKQENPFPAQADPQWGEEV